MAQRARELRDDDPSVRRYAAWALGELEIAEGAPVLSERLFDNGADVRMVAAWALGEIKEHQSIDPLIALLEDEHPLVREMAVLALGEIEHSEAVGLIMQAVEAHAELREPAFWALGEIGGALADEARSTLDDRRGHRSWENDEVWTDHLRKQEPRSASMDVTRLVMGLREGDPQVRRSAAEALGRRSEAVAVNPLLDALRDPVPSVRATAIWALDEINPSRRGT